MQEMIYMNKVVGEKNLTICIDEDLYKAAVCIFDNVFSAFQKERFPLPDTAMMYIFQIHREPQPLSDCLIHFDPENKGAFFRLANIAEGFFANALQCTILHGSLVRMCEKNILMIGARRSGKTTLTRLFLEKYGSEYIDDDCVYIVDGVYRGFHMPVFMRDGEDSRAELTTVDEEGVVRRVFIPRKRVEAVEKIDIILFPHFQEGTETDVCRIEGTNLFCAIINNTRHHCDRRLLMHDIARLANQAKAYKVTYGSSDQAGRFIEKYIIGSFA